MNARQALLRQISEKAFQQQVIDLAHVHGWLCYHTFDARKSAPGFPDLCLVRLSQLLFVECKTEKGKLTKLTRRGWIAFGRPGRQTCDCGGLETGSRSRRRYDDRLRGPLRREAERVDAGRR